MLTRVVGLLLHGLRWCLGWQSELFLVINPPPPLAINPPLFRNILRIEKHCVLKILKILGLKNFGPPQAENFEDFGGCFMQKMPPDCTQERVFKYKNASKIQKKSACGGHIIIEIRLVNAPQVYFFRACGGPKSQCFLVLCLSTGRL